MVEAVVVFDKGHGLPDPGAVGIGQEYIWASKIADRVAAMLPSTIKIVYTRKSNRALSDTKSTDLNLRCKIANDCKADLFVSYHLNAGGGTGYETLWYKPNKEGKVIHGRIVNVLKKYGVKDRGFKERNNVRVLNGTNMPALLLECLFIDNATDMKLLNTESFFYEFCKAIAEGICEAVGVSFTNGLKPAYEAEKEDKRVYRLVSGTITGKPAAEASAEKIRKQHGMTVYLQEQK